MKILGFALVVLGIFALAYGGIGYDPHGTVVDAGILKGTAPEQRGIALSPFVGGIALIGGIFLLAIPRRPLVRA